jgi:predicted aspartyl protease
MWWIRLDEGGGDIIPFELPSGRAYKALMMVIIGLTADQEETRRVSGSRLPRPLPPYQALIDTGSQQTYVKRDIIELLGLEPVSDLEIETRRQSGQIAAGRLYDVNISFGGAGKSISVVSPVPAGIPHDVLIGTTLLTYCLLSWDGPAGKFSIRIPEGETEPEVSELKIEYKSHDSA